MLNAYRLLLEMMTPGERARFWLLVGVTFVLSVVEAVSVLSILPFLQLLSDPDLIFSNPTLSYVHSAFGFEGTRSFLVATGIAVFCITVFGLMIKMVTIWMTTRFALMRSYSFSARLLEGYLHQPYEWFLSRHSSEIGNTVLSEVDRVISESLLPAMRIVPDTFVVLLLVVALSFVEPWVALSGAAILGGSYGLIFMSVRLLLTRLGKVRLNMNRIRFHAVQEATGGIKEIKLIGLEQNYLTRFRDAAFRMAQVQTRGQVISNLPRYMLEAVAFGGMILLILALLVRGDGDITALIPTLGLIAAIGLRLIPALQQIYSRGSALRQSAAALDRVHADMTGLNPVVGEIRRQYDARPTLPLANRLELKDIHYEYPEAERAALKGLTLAIDANTTIGIVGGTGAGKTTLIDIILGLLEPSAGEMRVDSTAVTADTRRAWQKTLGYVPQTIFLSDGSVAENIAFGLNEDEIDMVAVKRAAQIASLHDFVVSELPNGYDTDVGERGVRLSGGQRQRVGIARALYHDPSTLIFDEATSALDTLTEAAVMEAVRNIVGQKTIMMIAHRLTTVQDCDCIFVLRDGQVAAAGRFDELVETDEEFRRMAKI